MLFQRKIFIIFISILFLNSGFIFSADIETEYFQEEFTRAVLPDLNDEAAIEHSLRQAEVASREVSTTAQGISNIAQSIALISKSSNAGEIGELGTIGVSIASNMYLLTLPAATLSGMGIAPFFPYAGIALGICSLIYGSRGNGIGKALAAISCQIAEFHHDVMIRFDQLELQLDEHHRKVMYAFFELYKHQDELEERLDAMRQELLTNQELIKSSINKMETNESERHRETIDQFAQLRLEEVEKTISDVNFAINSEDIDCKKLVALVRQIYKHVNIVAKNSTLSGARDPESLRAIREALSTVHDDNPYNHPAFSNIDMIKNYCQERLGLPQSPDVINPRIWARCIGALNNLLDYAQKLSFETESAKKAVISDIAEIAQMGHLILFTINQMGSARNIDALSKDCVDALEKLKQFTDQYMTQHVSSSLKKDMIKRVKDVMHADLQLLNGLPGMMFSDFTPLTNQPSQAGPIGFLVCRTQIWNNFQALVAGRRAEYANRIANWKGYISQIMQQRIAQIECGAVQGVNVPLSQLVFPAKSSSFVSAVKRPFLCTGITVSPEYVKAELCGLCRIVSEFDVDYAASGGTLWNNYNSNNTCPFYIRVYMESDGERKLLREYKTTWKEISWPPTIQVSEDSVYGHLFGGPRFTTAMFEHHPEIVGRKAPYCGYNMTWGDGEPMCQYLPHTSTPPIDFSAVTPVSYEAKHLVLAQQLLEKSTCQKRIECNRDLRDQLESVSDNRASVMLNVLDMRYKVLEAVVALTMNAKFKESPACALFNVGGVLRNKADIEEFTRKYAQPQTQLCENDQYMPFDKSIAAFQQASRNLVSERLEFPAMQSSLSRLRYLMTTMSGMRVIPRQPRTDVAVIQRLEACAAEAAQLREGQNLLKGEISELRGDMNSRFDMLGVQLSLVLAHQQKLLER